MTQELYDKLFKESGAVEMVRPNWAEAEYHIRKWKQKSITVLITQRKTPELIRLCLESLLQFYPDIPVVVVDGDSQDESSEYLKLKSVMHPNVGVVTWIGRNSHGAIMDLAIRDHIKTEFVMTLDSDMIICRGGFIEEMLEEYKTNPKLYSIGSLMLVTRKNFACGAPEDEGDILRYTHPSLSIFHIPTYKTMRPFSDHGAPCVFNLLDAELKGLEVKEYPVDKYAAHCSGASWTVPNTIWTHDNGVLLRPLITFIISLPEHYTQLRKQTSHDFDIVTLGTHRIEDVVIHYTSPVHVSNYTFDMRFRVTGEYICWLSEGVNEFDERFVELARIALIEAKCPDEIDVGGLMLIRRRVWQGREALA